MSISDKLKCGTNCPNRYPGCHDNCEKYQEHKKQRAEIIEKRHRAMEEWYFYTKRGNR